MDNLLQEKQKIQQAPLAVPLEQNTALIQQQQQMRQEQTAPLQQEQLPAAPMDAAPAQTQKKKTVAKFSKHKVYDNFSDERKNAFHRVLHDNCVDDAEKGASPQFKAAMAAVQAYASLPLDTAKNYRVQSKLLREARKLLRRYQPPADGAQAEPHIIERYRLYFDTYADGQLRIPADLSMVSSVDYSTREIKKSPGLLWHDMSDRPLFAHEPSANDIQQGCLGDCYLLAGLSSLARNTPEKIKECMRDNGNGTVTVRFFKRGYPTIEAMPQPLQNALQKDDPKELSPQQVLVRLFSKARKGTEDRELLRDKINEQIAKRETQLRQTPDFVARMRELEKKIGETEDEFEKYALESQISRAQFDLRHEAAGQSALYALFDQVDQDHAAQAEVLVKELCAQAEFAPILQTIEQAQAAGLSMTEVLAAAVDRFDDTAVDALVARMKTAHPEWFDALEEQPPLHPVYVTVKKTVPRMGTVDAYAANSLWVQMIEKAYVASGLHLEPEEYQKKTRDYRQISGGYTDAFLETLTGTSQSRTEQPAAVPRASFFVANQKINPLCKFSHEPVIDTGLDEDILDMFQVNMEEELIRRFRHTYTLKENGKKIESGFIKSAITIEDIREVAADWRNWAAAKRTPSNTDLAATLYQKMQTTFGDEQMEQHIRTLANHLEQYYDQADHPTFEHRRFAQHADGSAHYTQWALSQYDKIQQMLQNGQPVTVGTQAFIPAGLHRPGLNGEAMSGGLAQGHAYSVAGCEEIDGRKYITLRNPWANTERQYVQVTNAKGEVAHKVRKRKQRAIVASERSGMFHMELNDFMNSINMIFY